MHLIDSKLKKGVTKAYQTPVFEVFRFEKINGITIVGAILNYLFQSNLQGAHHCLLADCFGHFNVLPHYVKDDDRARVMAIGIRFWNDRSPPVSGFDFNSLLHPIFIIGNHIAEISL